MKLSNVSAKLTSGEAAGRSTRIKTGMKRLSGLALAGAALALATPVAHAQQWGVGVEIGGPRYVERGPVYQTYAPAYAEPRYGYAPNYWQERRAQEWREQQWREHQWREQREQREHQWREHEDWEHRQGFEGRRDDYRPY